MSRRAVVRAICTSINTAALMRLKATDYSGFYTVNLSEEVTEVRTRRLV